MNDLLIAAVGGILTALIAYPLGRVQGRQQTGFEERAKVMVELRRRLLAADKVLAFASTHTDQTLSSRLQDELLDKIGSLGDYYQENNLWLDHPLEEKLARIIRGYDDQARALVTGHHGIPPPPHLQGMEPEEVYEEVRKWYRDEGSPEATRR